MSLLKQIALVAFAVVGLANAESSAVRSAELTANKVPALVPGLVFNPALNSTDPMCANTVNTCYGRAVGHPQLRKSTPSKPLCMRFFDETKKDANDKGECLGFSKPKGKLGGGNENSRECLAKGKGGSITFSCSYPLHCCHSNNNGGGGIVVVGGVANADGILEVPVSP